MRAYRVASARTIAPFGERARDLFIGAQTLAEWQAQAVHAAGLTLHDVASFSEVTRPSIAFFDDVWFTEMAFRQVAAEALSARRDLQVALDGPVLRALEPLSGGRPLSDGATAFELFVFSGEGGALNLEAVEPWLLPQRTFEARVKLPPAQLEGEGRSTREVAIPVTARIVGHIRHWIHLLRASQLSIGVTLLDQLRAHPRRLLRLRFGRRDPITIARKLNFIHPTARVHPTADLESAVIGPGCVIAAHAHVHRSVLGPNVQLGDHAIVMGCTLAAEVQVLRNSYLAFCAAMPGATLASYKVQLSLFGREAFLTSSAWLIDAKFQGEVRVEHQGQLVSTGSAFLGGCLGHRATLGANVGILPGRAVPNGCIVVTPPGTFAAELQEFPEGTVLTVRNGRLEPI